MHRREFLGTAGAALAAGALPATGARAAAWPEKPVKFILPYAPGGATDLIARPWAEVLSKVFGQQFVLEHRGGAGGMIGTEAASKAAPDGYSFLFAPSAVLSILPHLRQTPYDAVKGFEPVARVGDLVCGFVIHPSIGPKTFQEMVDYAKKNPGKLSYGSAGLGTSTQLRLEMMKFRAGIDILHVPYRGSADALNDLLPGNVHMMNEIIVLPHVKAGKLNLLNINHATRSPDFPEVPTLTELGHPNSDVPIWYSIQAPAGTPKEIIQTLNAKVVELAKTDDMQAKIRAIYCQAPTQTPDEMRAFLEADSKRNAELIKAANIKLE